MKEIITQSRPRLFAAVFERTLLTLGLLLGVAGIGAAQDQQPPDALTITKEGNVGVGTTAPTAKIDVAGSGWFRSDQGALAASAGKGVRLYFDSRLGIGEIFAQDYSTSPSKPNNLVLQHYGGNVGIGTPTPNRTLDVNGVVALKGHLDQNGQLLFGDLNSNTTPWMTFPADSHTLYFRPEGSGKWSFFSAAGVAGLAGVNVLTMSAAGNVGIGTTNPAFGKLQVTGDATTALRLDANSGVAALSIGGTGQLVVDAPGVTGGRFIVKDNGNVGIGTTTPDKAKLEIGGSFSEYQMPLFDFFTLFDQVQRGKVGKFALSLYAENRIAASHFMAFSDERIKNIQGRSDSAKDLQTLLGIEVTDFQYKDVIGKGSAPQKKVIGQQVEKVFPQAVSKQTNVVPDIYRPASIMDGWVELATDLKKGERIRLSSDKTEGIYEVLEVAPDKFRVDFKSESEKVFVFGREVNDFRTLDYDAIAMLNVSATQQLKKEKDAEVKALQDQNAALRSQLAAQVKRLAELEAKDKSRDEKLAAIEMRLLSADKPATRTASLKKLDCVE